MGLSRPFSHRSWSFPNWIGGAQPTAGWSTRAPCREVAGWSRGGAPSDNVTIGGRHVLEMMVTVPDSASIHIQIEDG